MSAYLYLSTGDIFPGEAIGYQAEITGEVLLYQSHRFHYEILTDPSHFGRIVVSDALHVENRWPLVGEIESYCPHLKGLVLLGSLRKSPLENEYYNLRNYLATNMVTGFKPEEPEQLLALLSKKGIVFGAIANRMERSQELVNSYINSHNRLGKTESFKSMSTTLDFIWDISDGHIRKEFIVVAYDLGLPYSLLRNLSHLGCDIRVVPPSYAPEETVALKPEGILIAGGALKPERLKETIAKITRLVGLRPILACGLGHTLLGMALGAKIEYLSHPHFGCDIEIDRLSDHTTHRTSQAHIEILNRSSLEKAGFKVTLINASDRSVEGYINDEYLIQSYAFSLGGKDSFTLSCLKRFINSMAAHRARNAFF